MVSEIYKSQNLIIYLFYRKTREWGWGDWKEPEEKENKRLLRIQIEFFTDFQMK